MFRLVYLNIVARSKNVGFTLHTDLPQTINTEYDSHKKY